MPARRLLMRKIREVLRLRHEQGLSHQAVARVCAIGVGTVNRYGCGSSSSTAQGASASGTARAT